MWEEGVVLEDSIDGAAIGRKGVKTRAAHPDFAAGRLLETGDEPEERGLSRTAFAEEREEFAGGNFERDTVENGTLAETLGDVADLEKRRGIVSGRGHWAAFTSFQISMYLARRGTSCQK